MPHLELKYSSDLKLNVELLFEEIEILINQLDPSTGACKARAYPPDRFKHTHLMVDILMLPKSHRDQTYTKKLIHILNDCLKKHLEHGCYASIQIFIEMLII